ncbi:helicase associated domain-containing protein, partial [Streptomyces lavendulae]
WQRGFHLVRQHLDTGQPLPTAAGEVVRQGEDDEMVLIGQYMANLRRTGAKNGLGKDQDTATTRAAQLTQIDNDWNCPWPLDWQRHHRILADLGDTEAGGVLPDITPGVLFDGDDIGRWLQQQKQPATWTRLLPEQQARLTALGVEPAQAPPPAPAAARAAKGPSKAQQAFQRGLAALTQWIEREGTHRPIPRAHSEQITVDGETEPVMVKLGVWVSNTKSRRDKLTQQHLDALRELGVDWA